jgi:hypothetical protein
VWTEDGTEVVGFHLSQREAEMEAARDDGGKYHLDEYTLRASELIGENRIAER